MTDEDLDRVTSEVRAERRELDEDIRREGVENSIGCVGVLIGLASGAVSFAVLWLLFKWALRVWR